MNGKDYEHFGVMIDASRNAVMRPEALKRFLPLLKKMGYNTVMLYTEDTYTIEGEPYFGYMRGRYSREELRELDAFAISLGMELIPCIQTLAHLNTYLRWEQLPADCMDIALVDDPRTYELIDHMFATLSECFSSRLIHIGMDEAMLLGRGRFLEEHGYEEAASIMQRHLARVEEIAGKYGFQCMLWSDMFFRSWNNGNYYASRCEMPEQAVRAVGETSALVYWDYYHTAQQDYDGMLHNHRQLSDKLWFAGGAWSWLGATPSNRYSLQTMLPAMRACREHGIRNIFLTMWGDYGGDCSHFSQLASLYCIAEYARGNEDEERIRAGFRRVLGAELEDFMLLDAPNRLKGVTGNENPARYMLYSDYFNGFLDYTVDPDNEALYRDYGKKLHALSRKYRRFAYVFRTQAALCDVLAVKYALGYKTRRAYVAGDRQTLRTLAEQDYREVEKRLRAYHRALQAQWFTDNKPCGFDVQDLRLGGILQRTISCRRRLLEYVQGKTDRIPELEEPLLPFGGKQPGEAISMTDIAQIVTTNVYC